MGRKCHPWQLDMSAAPLTESTKSNKNIIEKSTNPKLTTRNWHTVAGERRDAAKYCSEMRRRRRLRRRELLLPPPTEKENNRCRRRRLRPQKESEEERGKKTLIFLVWRPESDLLLARLAGCCRVAMYTGFVGALVARIPARSNCDVTTSSSARGKNGERAGGRVKGSTIAAM
jgi:hypothetical protein